MDFLSVKDYGNAVGRDKNYIDGLIAKRNMMVEMYVELTEEILMLCREKRIMIIDQSYEEAVKVLKI